MHRMKGLEFSRVLLAGVQRGVMPYELAHGHPDEVTAAEYELRERCLLYVSCTRARDELVVTGFGGESPFLKDHSVGTPTGTPNSPKLVESREHSREQPTP